MSDVNAKVPFAFGNVYVLDALKDAFEKVAAYKFESPK